MSEKAAENNESNEQNKPWESTEREFAVGDWASRIWGEHGELNKLINAHPVAQHISAHSDVESIKVRYDNSDPSSEFRVLIVLKESAQATQQELSEIFPKMLEFILANGGTRQLSVEFIRNNEYRIRQMWMPGTRGIEPINRLPIVPLDWIRSEEPSNQQDEIH